MDEDTNNDLSSRPRHAKPSVHPAGKNQKAKKSNPVCVAPSAEKETTKGESERDRERSTFLLFSFMMMHLGCCAISIRIYLPTLHFTT